MDIAKIEAKRYNKQEKTTHKEEIPWSIPLKNFPP